MSCLRSLALLIALSFAAAGCQTAKQAGERVLYGVNPVASADATVLGVSRHGPYLLVSLSGPLVDLQFFAPATETCLAMLTVDSTVNYGKSGVFGRFRSGDAICDPVGVASLAAWRDRQPRRSGKPVPRATARYHVLQEDPELIFLRGRFPLASRVAIPAGYDIVAVVPNQGACAAAAQLTDTSMEFRVAGNEAFTLLANGQVCQILGFAMPLAPVSN